MNKQFTLTMLGICTLGMVTLLNSCKDDNDDLYDQTGIIVVDYDGPNAYDEPTEGGESANNTWTGNPAALGYEVPALRQGDGIYFVSHDARISDETSTTAQNYCLEWDASAMHSRWVAFVFDNDNKARRVSRTNAWSEDPSLPLEVRLSTSSYSGSSYTRGHICASADRLNSTQANQQTFYMSNMTPQLYDYNGGYWAVLEAIVQSWGRSTRYSKVYVCKGGTIRDDQRLGTFNTTSANGRSVRVAVPKYNFMAVLAQTTAGSYQAVGFWMEHKDYVDAKGENYSSDHRAPNYLMKSHAMSIKQLESLTGINFFCNLDDAVERPVESSYSESAWNW